MFRVVREEEGGEEDTHNNGRVSFILYSRNGIDVIVTRVKLIIFRSGVLY